MVKVRSLDMRKVMKRCRVNLKKIKLIEVKSLKESEEINEDNAIKEVKSERKETETTQIQTFKEEVSDNNNTVVSRLKEAVDRRLASSVIDLCSSSSEGASVEVLMEVTMEVVTKAVEASISDQPSSWEEEVEEGARQAEYRPRLELQANKILWWLEGVRADMVPAAEL